jgi:hypothetical protein
MSEGDPLQWARALGAGTAMVMHIPTDTVAKVKAFYDGVTTKFISPITNEPVNGPVLVMEDGNSFMAEDEKSFHRMTMQQAQFYRTMQRVIANTLREAAQLLKSLGIPVDVGVSLLVATLKAQLRVLEAKPEAMPQTLPPEEMP